MSIEKLVQDYESDRQNCLKTTYNETQLRNDFIDRFLKCLGWDVDNEKRRTQYLREVLQEEPIEVEGEDYKKNPDYTLRINGSRKLFVEVKKPSVRISEKSNPAFQIRRYGWNANMLVSVLTNFEYLVIYDCRYKPVHQDNHLVARYKIFHYTEYAEKFEEIEELISYGSVNAGKLEDLFSNFGPETQTFDEYFLEQIERWRSLLAITAVEKNNSLDEEKVNFLIQRLINRIIFLRICEDRRIEKFETLRKVKSYEELKKLFQISDEKFNSGLFDFIEDTLSLNVEIDSSVLIEIFKELYYPLSPYDFSVVDPTILSQIYERFLGSRIAMEEDRVVSIVQEPEVSASSGVVPTPKIVVEQIVRDTLSPVLNQKDDLENLKVLDMCCGSGTFLLSAYDYLMEYFLKKLTQGEPGNGELISENSPGTFRLTLQAKRLILTKTLYGVDINPYATEVTKFSLLLKLLEEENEASIRNFRETYGDKVLPNLSNSIKCGNSLVDSNFFNYMPEALDDDELLRKINPLDWEDEFPFLKNNKFDAIIGNPPYVRIQNMVRYISEEVKFYQSQKSSYIVAAKESPDKYYVFIQKALGLLNDRGYLGYIVPHKFFILKGGKSLRNFITSNSYLSKISHFGVTQVFPGRSTYTAILIIQKAKTDRTLFRRIQKITPEVLDTSLSYVSYETSKFDSEPWIFVSPAIQKVFNKLETKAVQPLDTFAEVSVGVQTSANPVYIFIPTAETDETYTFQYKKKEYTIEKKLCLPVIFKTKFDLFDTAEAAARLIFPYKITEKGTFLIDEEGLKKTFPLGYDYLCDQKEQLLNRKVSGKKIMEHYELAKKNNKESPVIWYQFGRSQSLNRFHNAPKLVWSVMKQRAPYAYDANNLQYTGGGNGPHYGLLVRDEYKQYSLFFFLGILAHPVIERMVQAGASEFQGAYYSHGKQFIKNIPVPEINFGNQEEKTKHDTIVHTVENLIATKLEIKRNAYGSNIALLKRKMNVLERQLTEKVSELYGLTQDDVRTVEEDQTFTADLVVK